jgi:hypothetical protein
MSMKKLTPAQRALHIQRQKRRKQTNQPGFYSRGVADDSGGHSDNGFGQSMLIGAMTNSGLLGGLMGGNFMGGIVGDALNGGLSD